MSCDHTNIASHLPVMARRQPNTTAVIVPASSVRGRTEYRRYSYQQLEDLSECLARGLAQIGIERGMRTVLMVKPSLEFFALAFSLFKLGAVMVGVDPGLGAARLGRCLGEAEPAAFIAIAKAHWARRMLGWARKTVRINVVVGPGGVGGVPLERVRRLGAGSRHEICADTRADEMAAVLFTSGSTGAPKGVVYEHRHFDAQVRALQAAYSIEPGEVDLATFPLFGLYAPAMGMTAVVPEMDFSRPGQVDPTRIDEAIRRFSVTNLFGSPALLDRVGRWGQLQKTKWPTLRRVISAGAPVPAHVIGRVKGMLAASTQVHTPYGATEALPVCSIGSNEILEETAGATEEGKGVCVGRPVGDATVRIIRMSDEPIAGWSAGLPADPGQIGEIVVSGSVVTQAYDHLTESTQLAKIADGHTPWGFHHRMGDLGYVDERGRLWFCGRKSQRVSAASGVHYTVCCEAIFNTHAKVARTALVGVVHAEGLEPALCVELESGVSRRQRPDIKRELLTLGAVHEQTQRISKMFFHRSFPVDIRHNAKIGREALARWAQRRLS